MAGEPSFTVADVDAANEMKSAEIANIGMHQNAPNVTVFDKCVVFNPGYGIMTLVNGDGEMLFSKKVQGDAALLENLGDMIRENCLNGFSGDDESRFSGE